MLRRLMEEISQVNQDSQTTQRIIALLSRRPGPPCPRISMLKAIATQRHDALAMISAKGQGAPPTHFNIDIGGQGGNPKIAR